MYINHLFRFLLLSNKPSLFLTCLIGFVFFLFPSCNNDSDMAKNKKTVVTPPIESLPVPPVKSDAVVDTLLLPQNSGKTTTSNNKTTTPKDTKTGTSSNPKTAVPNNKNSVNSKEKTLDALKKPASGPPEEDQAKRRLDDFINARKVPEDTTKH
jgi:hypothetical protein